MDSVDPHSISAMQRQILFWNPIAKRWAYDDVQTSWTQYIGKPDKSDLGEGTWFDYKQAFNSGVQGCRNALRSFNSSHSQCQ